MTTIVLASASPRRRELLAALVRNFDVDASNIAEDDAGDPRAAAARLAGDKAAAVAVRRPGDIVIGADTIVHDGTRPFGKPTGTEDAAAMLRALRGREHRVLTGIAVAAAGAMHTAVSENRVTLHDLTDAAIDAYVASGRPLDKAGAYAIQDDDVPTMAKLDGCYCAVMGLPLWALRALLLAAGCAAAAPDATFSRCATCPERR